MSLAQLQQHLPHVDPTSAAIGAVVARILEAAVIKAIKPLPRAAVDLLKKRVQALAAAGQIDAPTLRLLKKYAGATFAWVDDELPAAAGPAKMQAALDRLAAIPYLGILIRADRAGAQEVLQAAYDSLDQEAKTEAANLGSAPPAPSSGDAPPPKA